MEAMTLEQVRDRIDKLAGQNKVYASVHVAELTEWMIALDAHLAQGAQAVDDGMLPDALVPHSKEWYRLCERRFAVERMTISGELAEAIVKAISERTTRALSGEKAGPVGDGWTGEIECCDAKGFWLVLSDNCPFVPGQKVTIFPASPTPGKEGA